MKILITGGSRGIGKAISSFFESKGHLVFKPTRNELDLKKDFSIDKPEFDVIINNAAINPLKPILDIVDNDVMTINYYAPLKIIQMCLPYMIKQQYGRIINIGSILIEKAKFNRLAYSASKNALHSLTKSLTVEYAKLNILTNTISPGFIDTDLTRQNNSKEDILNIINNVPIKRLGNPEEIAKLVYHLTIDNTFVTGQNIIIDGGYSCIAN